MGFLGSFLDPNDFFFGSERQKMVFLIGLPACVFMHGWFSKRLSSMIRRALRPNAANVKVDGSLRFAMITFQMMAASTLSC